MKPYCITSKEKALAKLIQGDMPLVMNPYALWGRQIGMDENTVIATIKKFQELGIMRKFAALVKPQQAGITENAMIVWAVPDELCETIGKRLSEFQEISHCYERVPPFEKKYNLFTMIHIKDNSLEDYVKKLSEELNLKDFKILRTEKEFKKSSVEYFS